MVKGSNGRMRGIVAWLLGIGRGHGDCDTMVEVNDLTGLDALFAESQDVPVLLFKHSTACPISAAAYRRVAEYLEEEGEAAPPCYLVKVIEARPVSNTVAERLGVTHQSPQILLVDKGQCRWNASHGAIDGRAIRNELMKLE